MNYSWLWLLAQASNGNQTPTRFEQLLTWFNSNPVTGWAIAIFAAVAMMAAAVAALTGNLDKIFGFVSKYRPKKRELTEADRERLRRELIDVVLRQVVTRLEASLHHKIRLDLKRQEERQRVGRHEVLPSTQTSNGDAALERRYRFQPADRLNLIRTLNGLPSATFEELVFTLDLPEGQVKGVQPLRAIAVGRCWNGWKGLGGRDWKNSVKC
jgi:hypothetical protein